MDHAHYRYSALPLRSAAPLPAGLHFYVVLYLEHWDFQAPPGSLRDPRFVGEFGSFNPDYRSWSQREYGLRIGVFRLLEALQQEGLTPSVAANSLVLPRVPSLVAALRDLGASWLGHGVAATRLMHSDQPLQTQRDHIESALDALRRLAGPAQGWLSQDWGTSVHTFGLLSDAGLNYTLDWGNDDQPYWLEPAGQSGRRLLALPLSSEWDDVQAQWLRHLEPAQHAQQILQAARHLADECGHHQRCAVLGLGLHPWVWGMPSRVGHLRRLLAQLRQVQGLTVSTTDHLYAQAAARAQP